MNYVRWVKMDGNSFALSVQDQANACTTSNVACEDSVSCIPPGMLRALAGKATLRKALLKRAPDGDISEAVQERESLSQAVPKKSVRDPRFCDEKVAKFCKQ